MRCRLLPLSTAPPTGLGAVLSQKAVDRRGGGMRQRAERCGAAWRNLSSGRAASASAQAAPALSSCSIVRISWYDEAAGRKKDDASRRAKFCGEYRISG
jgi:hypothetical protein